MKTRGRSASYRPIYNEEYIEGLKKKREDLLKIRVIYTDSQVPSRKTYYAVKRNKLTGVEYLISLYSKQKGQTVYLNEEDFEHIYPKSLSRIELIYPPEDKKKTSIKVIESYESFDRTLPF